MEPDEADAIEMLTDAGEEELVPGLVHEMGRIARDREHARGAIENGERLAEVVDDRAIGCPIDDVPWCHERRRHIAQRVEIRLSTHDLDRDIRSSPDLRTVEEPGEVCGHRIDDLGPVTHDADAKAADHQPHLTIGGTGFEHGEPEWARCAAKGHRHPRGYIRPGDLRTRRRRTRSGLLALGARRGKSVTECGAERRGAPGGIKGPA